MKFENTLAFARKLDAEDPLRHFRDEFLIPEANGRKQVYFLGNSLGLQPKKAASAIQEILDQWARLGVESFFMGENPWLDYHDRLTGPLSQIIGALPEEISVMNQLTVNLHLMLVSFYRPRGKRQKILCEAGAFPSDQYMLETHIRALGMEPGEVIIEIPPRKGEEIIREEDILQAIDRHKEDLALVLWGGVHYYTGQFFNIRSITEAAHRVGAIAGFDLAHAVGNVPLDLHNWEVDFACWCSYKYLNSGPGGVGGVYIHERFHYDPTIPRFAGWWGYNKKDRFLMAAGFRPESGAAGWQLSTPSLILYATHRVALEQFSKAGMDKIQDKRRLLNAYTWYLLEEAAGMTGRERISFITPRDPDRRGCQVSILVKENGKELFENLQTEGFFIDWREPSVIRLAPVPLYNNFEEVWLFAHALKRNLLPRT